MHFGHHGIVRTCCSHESLHCVTDVQHSPAGGHVSFVIIGVGHRHHVRAGVPDAQQLVALLVRRKVHPLSSRLLHCSCWRCQRGDPAARMSPHGRPNRGAVQQARGGRREVDGHGRSEEGAAAQQASHRSLEPEQRGARRPRESSERTLRREERADIAKI